MQTRIAITGAAGRMGRMLLGLIAADPELSLSAAIERDGHPELGHDAARLIGQPDCGVTLATLAEPIEADVVVDFSLPEGTAALLDRLEAAPLPLVCGTTGLSPELQERLATYAKTSPVVSAPNFSTGVNLLFALLKKALAVMGRETEVEIVETHHRHKKDAPSGTARRLAEIAAESLTLDASAFAHGREGVVGERSKREIGVHAVRGGEVVGDHTVFLFGTGERLELTHRAQTREAFAAGALNAARVLARKAPGLYDMQDILDLKEG